MIIGKPQSDPTLEWFLSHCHIHKYPAKSTLIHAGEKAETLYYIVKGTVAVLIKDDEGKEMILSYLNQGDFLGEMGMFEENENPERSAWVRAKGACEVAEISYKKFRQLIQVNPDILLRLSGQMAKRLQHTSQKVGNLAFLDVTGRIAQTWSSTWNGSPTIPMRTTRRSIGRRRTLPPAPAVIRCNRSAARCAPPRWARRRWPNSKPP